MDVGGSVTPSRPYSARDSLLDIFWVEYILGCLGLQHLYSWVAALTRIFLCCSTYIPSLQHVYPSSCNTSILQVAALALPLLRDGTWAGRARWAGRAGRWGGGPREQKMNWRLLGKSLRDAEGEMT